MIWTVHAKPRAGREPAVEVVPDALAKWAVVFGTLWLLRHRLWWEALAFALLVILVNRVADLVLSAVAGPSALVAAPLALVLALLPRLWLLLEGNNMRRARLERAGYMDAGVVEAADAEGARLAAFAGGAEALPPAEAPPSTEAVPAAS